MCYTTVLVLLPGTESIATVHEEHKRGVDRDRSSLEILGRLFVYTYLGPPGGGQVPKPLKTAWGLSSCARLILTLNETIGRLVALWSCKLGLFVNADLVFIRSVGNHWCAEGS